MQNRLVVVVFGLGLVACSSSNPLREPAQGIASAALTGRGVSLALSAIAGTPAACVQVTQACTSFPCSGAATVTLDGSCTLPLGGAATGQISVTGSWSSASSASVSAQFIDVKAAADKDAVALAAVTSITASWSESSVTVSYVGSNAQARAGLGAAAIGGTSTWDVAVDTKGTADPSDDVLIVDSTQASGSAGLGASAKTVSFDAVTLDPSCTENPIAGSGSITEVSTFIPKITKIEFHAACDGKGEVNGKSHAFDYAP